MTDKLKDLIIQAQSTALDDDKLMNFVIMAAKLSGRDPGEALREFINADSEQLRDAYLRQRNEEQALEAIEEARKGDYELLTLRTQQRLITPEEERFLSDLIFWDKTPKGRPPSMRTRHPTIAVTVEAFRGAGTTLRQATVMAAKAWCLSEETITELYKRHKLPEAQMKYVREYFAGHTPDEVSEFIQQYRKIEKAGRK